MKEWHKPRTDYDIKMTLGQLSKLDKRDKLTLDDLIVNFRSIWSYQEFGMKMHDP